MSFSSLQKKKKRRVIGMMSGTSCDGMDLALVEIDCKKFPPGFKLQHTLHRPYTKKQKQHILDLVNGKNTSAQQISTMNFYLADIWSAMIFKWLQDLGLSRDDIDLIGSHGQTVWHQPLPHRMLGKSICSTLQLGDPAVIAQKTGITTVGDFRVADMALGGQGAPLVPYFDWIAFTGLKIPVVSLNIGGIANITWLPAGASHKDIMAFDTGPGNTLIDQLMLRLYERPFDRNGRIAALGGFSQKIFDYVCKIDDFPGRTPPKSTGREHYGTEFVVDILRKAIRWRIPEPDVIFTLTYYTAWTIHEACETFLEGKIPLLIASGGGTHNSILMRLLSEFFAPGRVQSSREAGIDTDFKEAVCFAVLASELIDNRAAGLPSVTGASRTALLGKICPV